MEAFHDKAASRIVIAAPTALCFDGRMTPSPVAYTFGYWGWGTNTERLVKLAAEWEEKAGRPAPLWVDIRWSRSVRARSSA